jgi:hypothetical protein
MIEAQLGLIETFEFFGIIAAVAAALLASRSRMAMWSFLGVADLMWFMQATLGASYWLYFYLLMCNAAILGYWLVRGSVALLRFARAHIQNRDPHRVKIDQVSHFSPNLQPTDLGQMNPPKRRRPF